VTLFDELTAILDVLETANVEYALIGGLAVAVWGAPRATKNLEQAWSSRARLPFGQRHVSVVSREALIAMKARAARPQDIMDIQNLEDIDR
jgi:hypothetical protein